LRESCEIDWYLQAELAYNKRFSAKHSVDKNTECQLDKKAAQKEQAKKIRFYNTVVIQVMKFLRY